MAAGLVDGAKIFMDSRLIQADASNRYIIKLNSLKTQLNRHYQQGNRMYPWYEICCPSRAPRLADLVQLAEITVN